MSKQNQRLLIQFAKWPELGQVKTRMQPHLNVQQSKALHSNLLRFCAGRLYQPQRWQSQLCLAGRSFDPQRDREKVLSELDIQQALQCATQGEGDLGARMKLAAELGLASNKSVVIVGSDCPFIDPSYIEDAFEQLESSSEVVVGPAFDGGYVLIGLASSAVLSVVFDNMPWSQSHLFEKTLAELQNQKVSYSILNRLNDIDRPEDLILLDDVAEAAAWY
ncbi:TIGR04282 family arsenosugar biosynthesis glycosyltransferase [uncultured Pseudoteredinibacter sp.]|uniref:TIGR04282 family arsenosugar biosynthesis glycosyltransferase n=1 Tax=uncultured Pseudoteredinibacter sp. TaxID=1641701 RepID=UPI00261EBA73|nr:TIGR04282 family arsenosugar biosynthesis glycosyltransferase [uncultured Pseudoteredinibacter sp.]